MAATKSSGAEFMMGNVGLPKKEKAAVRLTAPEGVTPAQLDEVETMLERAGDEGKKLATGLKAAVGALDRIAEAGFTPDLLVLMVTEKAPYPKNAKHKLTSLQIEAALKGLFKLGEFLR